jgi:hypothetical protein
MKVRCLLISVVALFVAGILATSSYAKLDPTTCVGAWLFEEGSGKVARDSTKNGNNGTLMGGPKWVDGKFGKALQFSGADDYVDAGSGSSLNLSSTGTVAFWFIANEMGRYQGIVSKNDLKDTDRNGYTVRSQGNNKIVAEIADASGNILDWSTTAISIGTWYFIVYEWDGKMAKFYTNGTLEDSQPQTLNPKSDVYNLFIGCEHETNGNPTYYFNGIIDEVAIFNVALAEQDIQSLMDSGLKGSGVAAVDLSGKLTTTWGEIKNSN